MIDCLNKIEKHLAWLAFGAVHGTGPDGSYPFFRVDPDGGGVYRYECKKCHRFFWDNFSPVEPTDLYLCECKGCSKGIGCVDQLLRMVELTPEVKEYKLVNELLERFKKRANKDAAR